MDNRQLAYKNLIILAEKQGYVTFDDIMGCADEYSLPIQDFDWLSSSITTRGILIYNEIPSNGYLSEDDYDDSAQIDYDKLYDRILQRTPSLKSLVMYVKNVIPPQRGEIKKLRYQIIEGNSYARSRMIEMHLRIALKLAMQKAEDYSTDLEDTISNAIMGLITAVDKYNPDNNGPFSAYATLWILQFISRSLENQRPLIYYPYQKKEGYINSYPLLKAHGCLVCNEFMQCHNAKQMIMDKLNCSEQDAKIFLEQAIPVESLDFLLESSVDSYSECGFEEKYLMSNEDTDESLQYALLDERINKVLSTLTPREELIIKLRFGLFGDGQVQTLEEIAVSYSLTRERIRQIEAKALRKLRQPSISRQLQCFWKD